MRCPPPSRVRLAVLPVIHYRKVACQRYCCHWDFRRRCGRATVEQTEARQGWLNSPGIEATQLTHRGKHASSSIVDRGFLEGPTHRFNGVASADWHQADAPNMRLKAARPATDANRALPPARPQTFYARQTVLQASKKEAEASHCRLLASSVPTTYLSGRLSYTSRGQQGSVFGAKTPRFRQRKAHSPTGRCFPRRHYGWHSGRRDRRKPRAAHSPTAAVKTPTSVHGSATGAAAAVPPSASAGPSSGPPTVFSTPCPAWAAPAPERKTTRPGEPGKPSTLSVV